MSDNDSRKYGAVGQACRKAMTRSKIAKGPTVTTLLLDAFVYGGGKITSGEVVGKGLCKEGDFTKWRKVLIERGWLEAWEPGDYSKHRCGKKLLKYVNDAKFLMNELATKRELEMLEAKIDNKIDREEFNALKDKIDWIIEQLDPPTNDDKRLAFPSKKIKEKLASINMNS